MEALLGFTDDDGHTPQVSDEEELGLTGTGVEELLVLTGTTGVVGLLGFTDDDDGHTPQVSEEEELVLTGTTGVDGKELLDLTGTTGVAGLLDFDDDDGHTPHVSDEEVVDLAGTAGVVGVLGFTEDGLVLLGLTGATVVVELLDDVQTSHVSDEEVVDLAGTAGVVGVLGFTEDGLVLLGLTGATVVVELLDEVQTPQDEEAGDFLLVVAGEAGVGDDSPMGEEADGDEEVFAGTTGVVGVTLEFPPQLPQDEDAAPSEFGLPAGLEKAGVAAGAEAGVGPQLPQLEP